MAENINPLLQKKLVWESKVEDSTVRFWTGYTAEVYMVSATSEPDRVIALGMRGFTGVYEPDITPEEVEKFAKEALKTKLAIPLEWVNFVFLVRNVPRYFTHQLVRTRVGASFVQESTRTWDNRPYYDFILPRALGGEYRHSAIVSILSAVRSVKELLKQSDVKPEDTRTLLPHSVLTHVFWQVNLKALLNIYENRFCCQAESTVWLPLLMDIRKKIRAWNPVIESFISSPFERGESCGFNASFDKPCEWRKKGSWE